MRKNILILNGNPKATSHSQHLSDSYEIEAREYFNVQRFDLATMDFNPNLYNGYDAVQALEPCLQDFQQALSQAQHIVIVAPIWWGGMPAKLKGLFDRAFLPGFAFKYEENNPMPIQLLTGKSARLIFTMDAPAEYFEEQAAGVITELDTFILQYCGIDKANISLFGPSISSTEQERLQWQEQVKALGAQGS